MKSTLTAALLATLASAQQGLQPPVQTNVTVFAPPENYTIPKVLYGRVRALECPGNDVLLATWENYLPVDGESEGCPPDCPENPYIPIYESFDQGQTWAERSRVYDTQNGWGLRYQPELFELTEQIGDYEPGTLLVAANSIPADLNGTRIDIYFSTDEGHTWEFASNVAEGGYAVPDNQYDPIWEPFIVTHEGQLIVYYADQREPGTNGTLGQKLSHQVTDDLQSWGPVVERPGMPVLAELPNGKWIYVFEWLNTDVVENQPGEPAFEFYYRIADSPLEVADAEDVPLLPFNSDSQPRGTPYVVWTPAGGENGTLIAGDNYHTGIYKNTQLGARDAWEYVETPAGLAYSRSFLVLPNDPSRIMIIAPGPNPGVGDNIVYVSTIDIDDDETPYPERYTGHQATSGKCASRGEDAAPTDSTPTPIATPPVQTALADKLATNGVAFAAVLGAAALL
ncbi:uncharacterized protein J7T54_002868 [Emericellopsis cladophorae]|uniref:Uncharacterized protein n=1 Tax=Emericellopsis cladophorae TaxID=2686198 RepID=A0A9Q0BDE5_9HYPO|nr:uncharacterized protein J7T54_002868 [Emericellopsis cladophorae]KAI6780470.1 hypothetical protein J7T54_002868 [Emericellopsis cladophorae]